MSQPPSNLSQLWRVEDSGRTIGGDQYLQLTNWKFSWSKHVVPLLKREAACLVLDQGNSHAEAARSLGLVEPALRRWVNQLQQERGGVTPASKALTPEQQKIQELEARITRLEREKSILKKATALLWRKISSVRADPSAQRP
ncbi:transposase [Pseudomonas plecoglossicida]|uniref:transposase n=1 Tax=Pseudomonas plecoglossicida TaxID=70775 RepID=UPI0035C16BC4